MSASPLFNFNDSMIQNDEERRKTSSMFFSKMNGTETVFDREYIKNNFSPLKFSRTDIKNLSSDFSDQTLGGHRVYREELIDGKLAKVYEYKIRIIKYDDEYLNVEKKTRGEVAQPIVIVENNLIVPIYPEIAQQKLISVANNAELPRTPSPTVVYTPGKRGRPRKYPVGEEPYKKKRFYDSYHEVIPENSNNKNLFRFTGNLQTESPISVDNSNKSNYYDMFSTTDYYGNKGESKQERPYYGGKEYYSEDKKRKDDIDVWREAFEKDYF